MLVVPKRRVVFAKSIPFRIFVTPGSGFVAGIVLVMCRICCSHGTPQIQERPKSSHDTMNEVGGEFKTKIGNGWEMPIAVAKQTRENICQAIPQNQNGVVSQKRFEH